MKLQTIGILSPGDMGHAVGKSLNENGFEVITCLDHRSQRTHNLAKEGNIQDVSPLSSMLSRAELVMSILVPSEAISVANKVAEAIPFTESVPMFVDCNAVSPQTAQIINHILTEVGVDFIDGSIIGGPPKDQNYPRFYFSGNDTNILDALDGKGIQVRHMGIEIGRASAIKMCYAAGTKGTAALHAALLTAAEALGVSVELAEELKFSQAEMYNRMKNQIPSLPITAERWSGEMEEIAATFDHIGITPEFHQGAASMFRLLNETPFAQETPETVDKSRTLEDTISIVARLLNTIE